MTLNEINARFNDDTYEVFPFISKTRITLLKKGLYKKDKANFRGITAIYDEEIGEYKFPLYGMYLIEEDLVIVPEGIEMSEGRSTSLDAMIKSGYKQVERAPRFKTIFYDPNSEEAKLALANKMEFQVNSKHE